MNLAAVDIGSNATRLTIARPPTNRDYYTPNDLIEKFRFPCRLGGDVFKSGKIGDQKAAEIREVFEEVNKAILGGHVSKARVAATSAFRDASNGKELLDSLASDFNLSCAILSGSEEASYMSEGLERRELFDDEHIHMHMDIGGGSLELSVFDAGKFLFQDSLDVGALRLVEDTETGALKKDFEKQLHLIDDCLKSKGCVKSPSKKPLKLHGTGGNFKRLGMLKVENFNLDNPKHFRAETAKEMLEIFKRHPGKRLTEITSIKADNAALIVPSLMILQKVLAYWPAERIEVPDLTLSHTLLDSLI